MSKDFGQGIFDMEFVNDVANVGDLQLAKSMATKKVDDSKANNDNKRSAMRMIHNSHSLKALTFGMVNFSLSHQGLKTIK